MNITIFVRHSKTQYYTIDETHDTSMANAAMDKVNF